MSGGLLSGIVPSTADCGCVCLAVRIGPVLCRPRNGRSIFMGSFPSEQQRGRIRTLLPVRAASEGTTTSSASNALPLVPASAAEAVNLGLSLFSKGRVGDALELFDAALSMNPNAQEAQAALYNKACCHASREEGEKASQALREALGKYDLKFTVILNDPDMAAFRAMPEFKVLQAEARKGGEEVGDSLRRDLKLISEVQDPFRAVRKFFYIAFSAAAGISTLFTAPRLIQAIQGGETAPDVIGPLQNLAINLAGILVFSGLFYWENKKEEEQLAIISRNEVLSRLPLRLQSSKIVELVQLRENTRPVIIVGTKEVVDKAVKQAERYREELLKRGVLLIPLVWNASKEEVTKKKGFGGQRKPSMSPVSGLDDFEKRSQEIASKAIGQSEKRFKADPVSPSEWESWVRDQQEAEGVRPGEDVYIVLRLDGRVRKSGRGIPDWQGLIDELPPLDALLSKLEK